MKTKWIERFVEAMINRALSIGFVWLWVAILNPPIATNLVWLIAILFAEIQVGFTFVKNELK
jgi:hypothetical protein